MDSREFKRTFYTICPICNKGNAIIDAAIEVAQARLALQEASALPYEEYLVLWDAYWQAVFTLKKFL